MHEYDEFSSGLRWMFWGAGLRYALAIIASVAVAVTVATCEM